jgi:iron complex outermembrane receptor protein
MYSRWRNDYNVKNQTLLRSATTGAEIWKGAGTGFVQVNGVNYQLPTMAPQKGLEEHEQIGGRLRTRHKTGWNHSVQLSSYRVLTNTTRQASVSDPLASGVVTGTDTDGSGTGWRTFELQSAYTPGANAGHALTFGYHQNNYVLNNQVFNMSNWNSTSTRTTESQNYYGKTEVKALYGQDAWRFLPSWTATFGLRLERFRAYDGSQYDAAATATPRINHADRTASGVSPKLSLAHSLNDDWLLRASLGRGIRFPTVSELFQGTRNGTTIYNNDPNMKPERSDAKELSLIREVGNSSLRVSLFEDDIKDAIFQQSQLVGAVTVSTVQNVQRVRTRGIETALQGTDLLIRGLDLQASLTLVNSKTLENPSLPASEGKNWPRVPRVRASALASYRTGLWTGSLGVKHEGRQYNTIDNIDSNPDTYGGVSSFTIANAKLGYSLGKQGSVALGVDNLTDRRYFVSHPYPGRTVFLEGKLSF